MKRPMKTIQMTLEDDLLHRIDKKTRELNTNRSAFIRKAVQYYPEQLKIKSLEQQHRDGYLKRPVEPGEFDVWEYEQI